MHKDNLQQEHNKGILHAILRQDLSSFIHKAFYTINPSQMFIPNWHINLICDYLKAVEKGEIKRLIINLPPRNLKSICITIGWTAWLLGQDPSVKIITANYAQSISMKLSIDTRAIIQSGWYKEVFPATVISNSCNKKEKFITTKHGVRLATSIGSSLLGEGADLIIIDDPNKPSDVFSTKHREKVINWYEQTCVTRLNNPGSGAIIVVMQRLHPDDLSGYLLGNKSQWELLKIPIIADQNYHFNLNNKTYFFPEGQILNPQKYDLDDIAKIEQEIGKINFIAQYLQSPLKQAGLVSVEQIQYYQILPHKFDSIIQSWDTAIKVKENSDYSVCTTWGFIEGYYYLLDLFKAKVTYPELKVHARNLIDRWQPNKVLIEDKNSGQSLVQDLQLDFYSIILPRIPKLDKVTRLATVLELFNLVKFPLKREWINHLIKELTSFPDVPNDDIVDSISQLLNYIKDSKKEKALEIRLL